MLNQAQISAARSQLGVAPIGPTGASAPQNRAVALQEAWGVPEDTGSTVAEGTKSALDNTASTQDTLGAEDAKQVLGGAQTAAEGVKKGADMFANPATDIKTNSGTSPIAAVEDEAKKTGSLLYAGGQSVIGAGQSIFAPIAATIQKLSQSASNSPLVQAIATSKPVSDFLDAVQNGSDKAGSMWDKIAVAHPDIARAVSTSAGVAMTAIGGEEATPEADVGDAVKNGADAVQNTAKTFKDAALQPPDDDLPPPGAGGSSISSSLDTLRGKLADVDPRLQISAQRINDPVGLYKDYASQAAEHAKDVKADDPAQTVGSEIGDQYDNVAQMRRQAGQQMATELDKVKDNPVDLGTIVSDFKKEATDGAGKMTSLDSRIVSKYDLELKALGSNPTVKDVDDFLGRVPNELDEAKSEANVTKITNADRIIKSSLASMREALTSGPGMENYTNARKSYAELSSFLDEGSRYLGAKTEGGDYTRDVSVAKGAVESLVGGGKKDWLLKLEDLTGYPAMDKMVMAIQAMKDAGDTRGLSLFKALAQGDIPTTPTGIAGKILSGAVDLGKKAVAGSPADRTAAFLRTLKK